jgi:sulfite reductase (NADPH) hemoprotein beta-component
MESKHPRGAAPVTLEDASTAEMSTVERLKHASEGLFYVQSTHESRHTMRSEIDALSAREAETISEHAKEIAKHFGIYKQRERNESGKKDGEFIFMVRVKNPAGGELKPAQWLALDAAAVRYGDDSIRLTARQGVQFHYVRGHNLHPLIRHINASYSDSGCQLSTLGASAPVTTC